MNKFWGIVLIISLAALISEYFEGPEVMGPLKMPKKESTWVKTEKVKTTRDDAMRDNHLALLQIPVNQELKSRLLTVKASDQEPIADSASCMARVMPLDLKRTAVQKAGGAWTAFEKHAKTKSYSQLGMQLDSKTNMMVFALGHLCKTAQGVPMDKLALEVSQSVDEKGREEVMQEMSLLTRQPATVEKWLDYAETAKANAKRMIDYEDINKLIIRVEPLVDFYMALSRRNVDSGSLQNFLSDAATLLEVLEQFLSQDRHMVMALNEDKIVPHYEYSGGM